MAAVLNERVHLKTPKHVWEHISAPRHCERSLTPPSRGPSVDPGSAQAALGDMYEGGTMNESGLTDSQLRGRKQGADVCR